ncbi:expressed unknown protein [Seminavis robusta]|uniref:Glycosyltransferase 61 catalytic domain-containing protein n=1 Tax=Seminavis robusta TaxID=568900 RepID=A0A9N8HXM7_9STRA|nr:expressed unknown protein [Seminavis robusta]|eukprot:Sro2253_g320900.1 n/a (658) ;mRNA; f:7034-9007
MTTLRLPSFNPPLQQVRQGQNKASLFQLTDTDDLVSPNTDIEEEDDSHNNFYCRHYSDVRNIQFDLSNDSNNTIYLLLNQADGCNIFHVLWGYVAIVRDAMQYGVLPFAREYASHRHPKHLQNLVVRILLPSCHTWLEMMIRAFPLALVEPHHNHTHPTGRLPVITIETERSDIYKKGSDGNLPFPVTPENCATFKFQWGSFLGSSTVWLQNEPNTSTARQMYQWTAHMRDYYGLVDSHNDNNPQRTSLFAMFKSVWSNSLLRYYYRSKNNDDGDIEEPSDLSEPPEQQQNKPLVLVVERDASCPNGHPAPRTAIDLETGRPAFPLLMEQMQQKDLYDVQLLQVGCDATSGSKQEQHERVIEQFRAFSNASVVVSVHGAQMTNSIFMKPPQNLALPEPERCPHSNHLCSAPVEATVFRPALVEISFRYGWCDDPKIPLIKVNATEKILQRWQQCSKSKRRYHKADFFRLATGMNIRYVEITALGYQYNRQDGPITVENPIEVQAVVVNSSHILEQLVELYQDQEYDYRKQTSTTIKAQGATNSINDEDINDVFLAVDGIEPYWIEELQIGTEQDQEDDQTDDGVNPYLMGKLSLRETLKEWIQNWYRSSIFRAHVDAVASTNLETSMQRRRRRFKANIYEAEEDINKPYKLQHENAR